jgi:hypothetical protein
MRKSESLRVKVKHTPKKDFEFRIRKIVEILLKETLSHEK